MIQRLWFVVDFTMVVLLAFIVAAIVLAFFVCVFRANIVGALVNLVNACIAGFLLILGIRRLKGA